MIEKSSEEKYRTLLENLPDGIYLVNSDFEFIYFNSAILQIFERSQEYLCSNYPHNWLNCIHPDDRQLVIDSFFSGNSLEANLEITYRIILPNGDFRYLRNVMTVIRGENGKIEGYQGIVSDFSNFKKAELDLKEREEIYHTIFDLATVGIVQCHLQTFIQVNNRFCEFIGYSKSELLGENFQKITHPDDYDALSNSLNQILAGKINTFSLEQRFIHKDGTIRWGNWTTTVLRDSQDNIKYGISMIQDITECKEAEQAAKKRERELQLITDALPVCISYMDINGRYRFVNQTYESWFGYKIEEILGKKVEDIIGESAYKISKNYVEESLTGKVVKYEALIPYENKGDCYVDATLIPDIDDESHVKGVYGLFTDITERVQNCQQIQYRLKLETALAQISQKLATNEKVNLNQILKIVGMTLEADYVYITEFRDDGKTGVNIFQWWRGNQTYQSNYNILKISPYQWWQKQLESNQNIIIPDIENLPESAKEEKYLLEFLGVCSAIAVPINDHSGKLWGQIALENKDQNYKNWCKDDAQLLGIVGETIYNYYSRIIALEKLRASQALYAGIFNNSTDNIFLLDVSSDKFTFSTINPSMEKTIHRSLAEVVGKRHEDLFPPEITSYCQEKYRACLAAQKTIDYEETFDLLTGKQIFHTILVPIKDSKDNIVQIQGNARNITKEKQALEEQFRLTKYQEILASLTMKIRESWEIPDILEMTVIELQKTLAVDRVLFFQINQSTGSGEVVNEAVVSGFPRMLGKIIDEKCYLPECQSKFLEDNLLICHDIYQSDLDPCYLEFLEQYQIRANFVIPIFLNLNSSESIPDDSLTENQINHLPWGLLCVQHCRDIRQWTDNEVNLLRQFGDRLSIALYQAELLKTQNAQQEELTRSNAELQQIAYIVSHDLQSPLNTISGFANLLQQRVGDQLLSQDKKYINYILASISQMQRQINDLLEYSQVGRNDPLLELTDFNEVLEVSQANLNLEIYENQAIINCEDNLPTIMADTSEMIQLFQNLIGNAIKYRSQATPIIKINSQLQDSQHWLFSFRDNGIGLDMKHCHRIFQMFQRLHTQDEYPGSGIGLAICQKIVQRHGGRIWVDSQLQQGSTFYFTIPS